MQLNTYAENAPTMTGTTRAKKMYDPHFSLSPKESLSIGLNKVSTTEVLVVTTALASAKNATDLNTVKETLLNSHVIAKRLSMRQLYK